MKDIFEYLKEHITAHDSEIEYDSIIERDLPDFNISRFLSFVDDNANDDFHTDWIGVQDDILRYFFRKDK
jgi:hypothetical protein